MARGRGFNVLVATDGSANAGAAVAATVLFPWPAGANAFGVVAVLRAPATELPVAVWTTAGKRLAAAALRVLRRRWRDAEVSVVNQPPVPGILGEARRRGAATIVLGSRGLGAVSRFILGSVSRGVVREARCPVLVVTRRVRRFARFVVGLDGSANARRALDFVTRLEVPPGGRIDVVRVMEPFKLPSMALMPAGVRATLQREANLLAARREAPARRDVEAAVKRLERAGWKARGIVPTGVPLQEILAPASGADCVVVGARGVGGVERLVLGSVAEGLLSRSPIPVLIVR